ncbi:AAA family ATPase [Pantanalinema rosaneae CENA516]|uniref:AAA family ATPase n=1 Tax=Pantanalinema rosaneae TaxID=1620701 RepID=UPI003D6E8CCA
MPRSMFLQAGKQSSSDLLLAFQRLDQRLEQVIAAAQSVYGAEAADDLYRGLYVHWEQVERELGREPGAPALQFSQSSSSGNFSSDWDDLESSKGMNILSKSTDCPPQFNWLAKTFDLTPFDLDLILIALAPEVDLRYERIYAYLQDDVTRKRPTVDLVLNLLCASAEEKLNRRVRLMPSAPLLQHQVLHVVGDIHQSLPPLLSHYLKLDEPIIHWLLGQAMLDPRLSGLAQLVQGKASWEEIPLEPSTIGALLSLTRQSMQSNQPLYLYFQGAWGAGKQGTAAAIAHQLNRPLLVADLSRLPFLKSDVEQTLSLLFREARLQGAVLYLDRLDELHHPDQMPLYQQLLIQLASAIGITILAGQQPWATPFTQRISPLSIPFPTPKFTQRRESWRTHLGNIDTLLEPDSLDILANRFRLTSGQIASAVDMAHQSARWQAATAGNGQPTSPSLENLFIAARAQSGGQELSALARKIQPHYTWEDLVLPADPLAQIRGICQQVKYQHIVYGQWGFERKLSLGKGLNALFTGPPGTGKTMTAEVIAGDLGLDLYKIDLSQVVSKYIGETEKNLNRIFTAAEQTNAILFFDEADALFGKRSEVKDAHDRYANIEIAYLLQKMEEYEGITILTTNLVQNLDEAFTRRIRFIVEFPFPDGEHRLKIWQQVFPQETPISPDVDFAAISEQFKLAGGNIRNIALSAAFLAAEAGEPVGMTHLLQSTRRELQKMGRLINEEEFLRVRDKGERK